jgi:hypothetical protein
LYENKVILLLPIIFQVMVIANQLLFVELETSGNGNGRCFTGGQGDINLACRLQTRKFDGIGEEINENLQSEY